MEPLNKFLSDFLPIYSAKNLFQKSFSEEFLLLETNRMCHKKRSESHQTFSRRVDLHFKEAGFLYETEEVSNRISPTRNDSNQGKSSLPDCRAS